MYLIDDIHNKVVNEHEIASRLFEAHLLQEDKKLQEIAKHEVEEEAKHTLSLEALCPETMNNTKIAIFQWYQDNPDWWKYETQNA